MTKSLRHKFVSGIADGADATVARPSNWNDDHDLWLGARGYGGPTADAITNADHLSWVIYYGTNDYAAQIGPPTSSNFPLGWTTTLKNIGTGIVTLTPTGGATFNGSASPIPLYPGDRLEIFSTGYGNGVDFYVHIFRAAVLLGQDGNGGRLQYVSATALSYKPFNGGYLRVKSTLRLIPATGIVGLANTGVYVNGTAAQNLTLNKTYYVFCFDNAGVLTADFADASTVSHRPSQTAGMEGTEVRFAASVEDYTRTLIGMVRTNAAAQFFDDATSLNGVASWNNRRARLVPGLGTGSVSGITSTTPAIQAGLLGLLSWADAYPTCG